MKESSGIDRRRLLLAGSAALLPEFVASDALAQDAVKVQPDAFRIVFENEVARILEFVSRPGTPVCGIGRHSHPAHLTIALGDAKVRVTLADGRQIVGVNKLGDVFWSEAETHTTENIGGGEVRALIVEFKGAGRSRA